MPKWDGFKPLPDHVVAPLLRALACIPRTADQRLVLRKVTDTRPPCWSLENDYDVMFRGRKVGRIWMYDYTGACGGEMARWLRSSQAIHSRTAGTSECTSPSRRKRPVRRA